MRLPLTALPTSAFCRAESWSRLGQALSAGGSTCPSLGFLADLPDVICPLPLAGVAGGFLSLLLSQRGYLYSSFLASCLSDSSLGIKSSQPRSWSGLGDSGLGGRGGIPASVPCWGEARSAGLTILFLSSGASLVGHNCQLRNAWSCLFSPALVPGTPSANWGTASPDLFLSGSTPRLCDIVVREGGWPGQEDPVRPLRSGFAGLGSRLISLHTRSAGLHARSWWGLIGDRMVF